MQTRTRRLISSDSNSAFSSASKSRTILEAPLTAPRGEVNQDAYLVLFSELVSYCRNRVQSVTELERKLADLGYRIGRRSLDLIAAREKISRREIHLLGILNFVSLNLWKFLFGKQADSLKKVRNSNECTYPTLHAVFAFRAAPSHTRICVADYIEEAAPLVNKYISVPKDYGDLNCAAFCAGIINGVLNSAGFPAHVSVKVLASSDAQLGQPLTIYYIKFDDKVLEREKRLGH